MNIPQCCSERTAVWGDGRGLKESHDERLRDLYRIAGRLWSHGAAPASHPQQTNSEIALGICHGWDGERGGQRSSEMRSREAFLRVSANVVDRENVALPDKSGKSPHSSCVSLSCRRLIRQSNSSYVMLRNDFMDRRMLVSIREVCC